MKKMEINCIGMIMMPQSVVRNQTAGMYGGNPVGDKWLYRFPHNGFPPTGKGMPLRRLGK
jgi:hypothetical protein